MPNLAAAPDQQTFRRLVEGEIGVDEYVKSLDERVRDREPEQTPTPPPADSTREKP